MPWQEKDNRNTRKVYETCSRTKVKSRERGQWLRFGVFVDNFENISHFFQVFLLLARSSYPSPLSVPLQLEKISHKY